MHEPQSAENSWWKQKLVDVFAIDPRSLAVFRIGIGLVLLYDLVDRMFDFEAMVLDGGILSVADAQMHDSSAWSLYFLSSADWFQMLLFGLTVVSCVMVLVGCFTRLATVCTWILVVSLQARMPLILNSGDAWLRMMLFWAMFLPLGRVWSIDAKRAGRRLAEAVRSPVFSIASAAVLVQIAVIYFFAGLAKWNDDWLSGNAMYYVFDQLIFLRPLGKQLLDYPLILRILCYSTLAFEIATPLLLFVPFGTKYLRIGLVLLVYAFHLGIELTLNVGHFSYIAFASWTLFLPALFWNSSLLAKVLPRQKRKKTKAKSGEASAATTMPVRLAKWSVAVFCAVCLVFTLAWNVSWIIGEKAGQGLRDTTEVIATTTKLSQRWKMFGKPFSIDPWYVYRARLKDGSIVDLVRNGDPPSDQRPTTTTPAFWNHRWKKLHHQMAMERIRDPKRQNDPGYHQHLKRIDRFTRQVAEYFCRKWNEEHGDDKQVVKLDVVFYVAAIGPKAVSGQHQRTTLATLVFAEPEEASVFQDELLRVENEDDPFTAEY